MESQYREFTFNDEASFEQWLNKTTYKKIFFKDKGQDLMKIWVAKSGEILHANLQNRIWVGRFINMENLEKDSFLQIWSNDNSEWDIMNFEIGVIK